MYGNKETKVLTKDLLLVKKDTGSGTGSGTSTSWLLQKLGTNGLPQSGVLSSHSAVVSYPQSEVIKGTSHILLK